MASRRWQAVCLATTLLAGAVGVALWQFNRRDDQPRSGDSPNGATAEIHLVEKRSSPNRPISPVDPSLVDYVGSDACRDCHSDIWEKYQSHPMAHSFAKVTDASPIFSRH